MQSTPAFKLYTFTSSVQFDTFREKCWAGCCSKLILLRSRKFGGCSKLILLRSKKKMFNSRIRNHYCSGIHVSEIITVAERALKSKLFEQSCVELKHSMSNATTILSHTCSNVEIGGHEHRQVDAKIPA
jgi:hypothetical protein